MWYNKKSFRNSSTVLKYQLIVSQDIRTKISTILEDKIRSSVLEIHGVVLMVVSRYCPTKTKMGQKWYQSLALSSLFSH
jgi:hypothetical protein